MLIPDRWFLPLLKNYWYCNYLHHNREMYWYGKRGIDNAHAHEPAQLYFHKKGRFAVA